MKTTDEAIAERFREVMPYGWEATSIGFLQLESFRSHVRSGNAVVIFRDGGCPKLSAVPALKRKVAPILP